MPLQSLSLDTSILPIDVLSFYDEKFYQIVEKIAGRAESKLLEAQGIRSVYSFFNTEDVFDILSISCAALKEIKKLVCFEADDNTFTVKPGCRSNILYLSQLLHQKHEEYLKEVSIKSKQNKQSRSQRNSTIGTDVSQDPLQVGLTSSASQQDNGTSGLMNSTDHHDFIIHVLNEWFDKNSQEFNLQNGKLIENEDFRLLIGLNGSSEEACISCSCRIKIHLTKNAGKFSLSNYYKHIKSNNCSMMKKKKTISSNTNQESNVMDDHESFDTEVPKNNSIANYSQSSASSITFDKNSNANKSLKRSIFSQKNDSLQAKRIRK